MRLVGLILAVALVAPAIAGEAEPKAVKKAARKAKAPASAESPALDKRVAGAAAIFVGEATRIYFVDRRFQEAPYIRAAGDGATKSAMILVKVTKVLHPANADVPGRVLIPIETSKDIFGDGRSPYDEQVERHVGKPGIWFGEIVVRNDYGDEKAGRKPLEDPVTLLQSWDAKKRPAVNSLPIKQLKEVENSIARVKKGRDEVGGMRDEEKNAQREVKNDKNLNIK